MKRVKVDIQDGFLKRSGWMGRWLTVYRHRYSGAKEVSGREHCHPWKLVISVVLSGGYDEVVNGKTKTRLAPSAHIYRAGDWHRLMAVAPGTLTLFIGLRRVQEVSPCYNETTRYGAAHYSEIRDVESSSVPSERAA